MRNAPVLREHSSAVCHGYARDVVEGRIVAGLFVRQACQRHLDDLETGHERGLYFDEAAADRALKFFPCLKHFEGRWARREFQLESWQQFIIGSLFGWYRDDLRRRFTTAHIEVARKNGKTAVMGGVGLYMLSEDDEPAAQVCSAATTRKQAQIVFDVACAFAERSRLMASKVSVGKQAISIRENYSSMKALSAEAGTLDGLNIHCALVDELHEHKDGSVYNVLDSATGARDQPMIISTTTAGSSQISFCWEQRTLCEKMLSGVFEDDSLFAYVATLDQDDDWKDESVWIKANPNLEVTIRLDEMRQKFLQAKASPSRENEFRRKRLNQWTRSKTRFIDLARWDRCAGDRMPHEIELAHVGDPCIAGLDLSSKMDLSAFVAIWRREEIVEREDGEPKIVTIYDTACRFWLPEETARTRTGDHSVPFAAWEREGFLTLTEGDVIDYKVIERDILEFNQKHPIRECAFDRWGATATSQVLQEKDLTMIEFGQGYGSMNSPTTEIEVLVMSGRLRHGGHPILRWMADNLEVETNAAGFIKPVKPDHKSSHSKIDGMVALIMALGRSLEPSEEEGPSVYEKRGLLWV